MSVNVYGYDKIPYPYYISEFVKELYHVDVLLHNNHYYLIRNMSTFASGEKSNRRKCYVCQCHKKFSDFCHLDKVRDHCHLSGKFRCTLCSTCILTHAKRPPEIHLFFHGLSNYDSHFIIQKLYNFSSTEIKIIPKNTEKYLSFSVGCVHFKDSYQFLSESLAILVQNLMDKGPDHFVYINKFIKDDEQ